jgi:glycosyltransferase involved in cell wall biosynthesis
MKERPRILLLIPHLEGGGAEQVTALLARGLSRRKYELHLALATQTSLDTKELPPRLNIHALGASRVCFSTFCLLRLIRQLKPDLILSGMAHLNFLVLLLRPIFPPATRVLVRQNATVSTALASGDLPRYTRLLYRFLYPRADRVICQTPAMARDLAAEIGVPEHRLAVLPNPVDVEAVRAIEEGAPNPWTSPEFHSSGPHLLAVGRLSREKGFDLLIRALVTVRQRFPNAHLVIAGLGPQEAALKSLCCELALEPAVHFPGYVDRPAAFFPGASLFVLSSRHEGLPNALLEAAAGGLPIVALPASQGIVDLLRGQPGVWLASEISASALASSLLAALDVPPPGQHFPHSFIEQFSFDRAISAYEDLIDSTLSERRL